MLLPVWFFLTAFLAALLLGTTFSHVLESPAKLRVGAPLWATLQQNLYGTYATIGGFIEIGTIVAAGVLAFLVRSDERVFSLAVLAAASFALAFAVWLLFTNPANTEVMKWTASTIPADWMKWRMQWEYSHAARFVFHVVAFSALLAAMLNETPSNASY